MVLPDWHAEGLTYRLPALPLSASSARECACESHAAGSTPSHALGAGPDSAPPPCPPTPLPASRELQIDLDDARTRYIDILQHRRCCSCLCY